MKRSEKAWRPVRAPVMNRFVSVVARLIAAVPAAADDQAVCFDETSRPEIAITACSKVDDTCKALRHDLAALYHGRAYLFREQGRR